MSEFPMSPSYEMGNILSPGSLCSQAIGATKRDRIPLKKISEVKQSPPFERLDSERLPAYDLLRSEHRNNRERYPPSPHTHLLCYF
ncbi:hypothetical protein CEXT_712111 [Caerostris extrusa]|uniref:Uncharacterized protein n=1 Tax=Caerostris extrusa TaxID=172846 RepID=A0AAV4QQC0_CAEEX|nr:hypothetical protein CEXT_712111 [Caerostris extrusa]